MASKRFKASSTGAVSPAVSGWPGIALEYADFPHQAIRRAAAVDRRRRRTGWVIAEEHTTPSARYGIPDAAAVPASSPLPVYTLGIAGPRQSRPGGHRPA